MPTEQYIESPVTWGECAPRTRSRILADPSAGTEYTAGFTLDTAGPSTDSTAANQTVPSCRLAAVPLGTAGTGSTPTSGASAILRVTPDRRSCEYVTHGIVKRSGAFDSTHTTYRRSAAATYPPVSTSPEITSTSALTGSTRTTELLSPNADPMT